MLSTSATANTLRGDEDSSLHSKNSAQPRTLSDSQCPHGGRRLVPSADAGTWSIASATANARLGRRPIVGAEDPLGEGGPQQELKPRGDGDLRLCLATVATLLCSTGAKAPTRDGDMPFPSQSFSPSASHRHPTLHGDGDKERIRKSLLYFSRLGSVPANALMGTETWRSRSTRSCCRRSAIANAHRGWRLVERHAAVFDEPPRRESKSPRGTGIQWHLHQACNFALAQ